MELRPRRISLKLAGSRLLLFLGSHVGGLVWRRGGVLPLDAAQRAAPHTPLAFYTSFLLWFPCSPVGSQPRHFQGVGTEAWESAGGRVKRGCKSSSAAQPRGELCSPHAPGRAGGIGGAWPPTPRGRAAGGGSLLGRVEPCRGRGCILEDLASWLMPAPSAQARPFPCSALVSGVLPS